MKLPFELIRVLCTIIAIAAFGYGMMSVISMSDEFGGGIYDLSGGLRKSLIWFVGAVVMFILTGFLQKERKKCQSA